MEKNSIFEDLMKIQTALETITKNSDAYKYKYADLPQVWNSIKKVVSDNGFVVNHEISSNGVLTVARHLSGKKLESFIPWSGQVKPQERGSEITYYKRYNIMAIFNIVVEGEDDDAKSVNDKVKFNPNIEEQPNCSICGDPMSKGKWGWYCLKRDKGKPVFKGKDFSPEEEVFIKELN
jgi:hypothetical protein